MELTKQKAEDINQIFSYAVDRGFLETFGFPYYIQNQRPDLDEQYLWHLTGLINHYMKKYDRKWIGLDGKNFTCNNNTKAFLESGGFLKIYEDERNREIKEQTDLVLAQRMLKDYPWTKRIAWIGLFISIILLAKEIIMLFINDK